MKRGFNLDVPAPEYHMCPAVSQSRLWRLRQSSPLHVRYEMDHPREATAAMELGRAVHCAVLEPERFALEFRAVFADGRTKEGKDERAEVEASGATVLNAHDWLKCQAIRDACASHKFASMLLDGKHEGSSPRARG